MAGYCISLFKYMRIDENYDKKKILMEKRKDIIDDEKTEREHEKFLAYGEFDRIGFEKVVKFSRFRDVSEKSKIWIGDRQTLLVYDIPDNLYSDTVFYEEGSFFVREGNNSICSEHLFVGITILQFKDSQKKNQTNMNEYLRKCKKGIIELVKQEMPDIKCSVLGTLSSFGLTIIWLADQYSDVLYMVTKIRNTDITNGDYQSNKSVFLSAYTIFAQNHRYGVEWDKKVDSIKGEAVLRITLKKGVSEEILNNLKKWRIQDKEIYHSAGEHDVIIRMKSANAFSIFSDTGDLYIGGEFVKRNVLQTNLQLCEDISEAGGQDFLPYIEQEVKAEKDYIEDENTQGKLSLPELENIQDNYKELRGQFKKFPSTAGMIDTLDWLYSDYIAKISTASNEMWAHNYSYQFWKILECLNKFVKKFSEVNMLKKEALQIINDLLSDFERQISHIAESNNLILGTPSCQFRYSGQNNLTLYSYFGIIKSILESIYNNQEVTAQAEIVPLIVADIVPIIKSSLFIAYANNRNETRIITINLPMMSLYDPVCYYPYFLHEISHYVVPRDRNVRNEILGCLISTEILNSICIETMMRKAHLDTQQEKEQLSVLMKDCFFSYSYSFVIVHYEDYIVEKKGDYGTNLGADEGALTAEEYEKNIYMKWYAWINAEDRVNLCNNPILLFFSYLYNDRDKLLVQLNSWKRKKSMLEEAPDKFVRKITDFINNLDALVNNPLSDAQDETFKEYMNDIGEVICEDAMFLVDAVKEALADIAMVTTGEMELSEYLLLFTKTKRELLIVPEYDGIDTLDVIRIGMVTDFLCMTKDDDIYIGILDNSKKDFIDMYCGLYCTANKSGEEQKRHYQQAEEWFGYWRWCFQQYELRYSMYVKLFRKLYEQLLQVPNTNSVNNGREESIYWKQYTETLKEYGNYIRSSDSEKGEMQWKEKRKAVDERIFGLNIELIHKFQAQHDFKKLNEIREEKIKEIGQRSYETPVFLHNMLRADGKIVLSEKMSRKNKLWEYEISTIGQLGEVTADIAKELKKSNNRVLGKNEYPIWYRGQQSTDYKLVPSIMRKYKQQKTKQRDEKEFHLVDFIRREFEEFRFRSDGSQESIERIGYTVGDYIALMQHYSSASNFLDWTEDALSALYFALEGFLDEKAEKTDGDAVLYILSPALYNHARKRMVMKAGEDKRQLKMEKEVLRNIQEGIPNLTVPFNEGKYEMYLLGKEEYADDNSTPYPSLEERNRKLPFYLPLAIYIPRLNRRIQAQSGIFMAYNIYTSPDEDDKFDYISLEEIQKYYFSLYEKDSYEEICPFLYKVIIKKEEREKVASWVGAFGMSKEKCYPELSNIGERIMK